MDTLDIKPKTLWTSKGEVTVQKIKFTNGNYDFNTWELRASYALLVEEEYTENEEKKTKQVPIYNGEVIVPAAVTQTWNQDLTVFKFILTYLGLEQS